MGLFQNTSLWAFRYTQHQHCRAGIQFLSLFTLMLFLVGCDESASSIKSLTARMEKVAENSILLGLEQIGNAADIVLATDLNDNFEAAQIDHFTKLAEIHSNIRDLALLWVEISKHKDLKPAINPEFQEKSFALVESMESLQETMAESDPNIILIQARAAEVAALWGEMGNTFEVVEPAAGR